MMGRRQAAKVGTGKAENYKKFTENAKTDVFGLFLLFFCKNGGLDSHRGTFAHVLAESPFSNFLENGPKRHLQNPLCHDFAKNAFWELLSSAAGREISRNAVFGRFRRNPT